MPTAYVLLRCKEGSEELIMEDHAGTNTIREILPTIGHYDLIAKISSPHTESIDEVIGRIHRDEKVRTAKVLRTND